MSRPDAAITSVWALARLAMVWKAVSSAPAWFMTESSRHIDIMNTGSVQAASTNSDPLLPVAERLFNISRPSPVHKYRVKIKAVGVVPELEVGAVDLSYV